MEQAVSAVTRSPSLTLHGYIHQSTLHSHALHPSPHAVTPSLHYNPTPLHLPFSPYAVRTPNPTTQHSHSLSLHSLIAVFPTLFPLSVIPSFHLSNRHLSLPSLLEPSPPSTPMSAPLLTHLVDLSSLRSRTPRALSPPTSAQHLFLLVHFLYPAIVR